MVQLKRKVAWRGSAPTASISPEPIRAVAISPTPPSSKARRESLPSAGSWAFVFFLRGRIMRPSLLSPRLAVPGLSWTVHLVLWVKVPPCRGRPHGHRQPTEGIAGLTAYQARVVEGCPRLSSATPCRDVVP